MPRRPSGTWTPFFASSPLYVHPPLFPSSPLAPIRLRGCWWCTLLWLVHFLLPMVPIPPLPSRNTHRFRPHSTHSPPPKPPPQAGAYVQEEGLAEIVQIIAEHSDFHHVAVKTLYGATSRVRGHVGGGGAGTTPAVVIMHVAMLADGVACGVVIKGGVGVGVGKTRGKGLRARPCFHDSGLSPLKPASIPLHSSLPLLNPPTNH